MRTILLLIILGISIPGSGQIFYVFNRLSHADGLNTKRVNCVWQDKKGFLWIGTENGIQRFDGRKFVNFRANEAINEVPPFGVEQILDGENGKLWLRQGNLVGQFDPVSMIYLPVAVKPTHEIPARGEFNLFKDSSGNIFLCVRKYGLLHYDPALNSFTERNLPIEIPANWPVSNLYEDVLSKNYWICSDSGLAVFNTKTKELIYRGHQKEKISLLQKMDLRFVYNFFVDRNNTWWIFYWGFPPNGDGPKVLHYDPENEIILDDTANINTSSGEYEELNWIFETSYDQLWIGGVNSLLSYEIFSNGFMQNIRPEPKGFDIRCREIKQMYEDNEGTLWLCTDNGLYSLSPENPDVFNIFFRNEPGQEIMINAILETNSFENWIGTWGRGILFHNELFQKINVDPYKEVAPENRKNYQLVWDLCQQSGSGLVWSGCQNGTIAIFDPNTKKIIHALTPPVFESASVRQIKEDHDGNLWFATQKGWLVKWKKGDEINDNNFEVIKEFNTTIYRLFIDVEERIWVCTHGLGVYVLNKKGETELHFSQESEDNSRFLGKNVFDVVQYNDSIFFLSTGFLNIVNIRTGEIKHVTQYNGLPGANVSQLMMDDQGILWFTHNNGLGSFNYQRNIFTSYNERNDLANTENPIYAKELMQNGEIWFGGENVLYGFRPEGLKDRTSTPKVTLTDFKLFNKYIPLDSLLNLGEITLRYEQNSFTFYFSSLSFNHQDKLTYYYQMEGVNKGWVKAENDLAANYTTLPPGRYLFKVKCVNMDGEESPETTSAMIHILPPFYRTWWFTAIMLMAIIGFVYFIYRIRINKLLAVEKIRQKVARDLHDDMGSTLSTINILSSMAKTRLNTDQVKTSEYISKITDNSQRMMEAMDDIIWSIKPDNDTMQKIIARMREYASGILEPKEIEITFNIEDSVFNVKLDMEVRRDLFLIFKEAINNVAKYSGCSKTDIFIGFHNMRLVMNIKDNGFGFDVNVVDSGNGLGNMRKRADAMKGEFSIVSERGSGTEVSLRAPVPH